MSGTPTEETKAGADGMPDHGLSGEAQTTSLDADAAYDLAGLALASGITERTIRYYQSEKLLPKPVKRGRERRYSEDHRNRIALIVELRDRGLTLNTIRDLVDNDDPARTVASWMGIDAALSVPWSDDRPRTLSLEELRQMIGDDTPGLLAQLHDAGYTRSNPDGTWTVPSPALVDLSLQLRRSGIAVEVAGHIRDLLRKRLAKAVDETVEYLVDGVGAGLADAGGPDQLATVLASLRPVAVEMTGLILAQEVERALADLITSRAGDLARSSQGESEPIGPKP